MQHSLVLWYGVEIGEVMMLTLEAYEESQAMSVAWTRDNGDRTGGVKGFLGAQQLSVVKGSSPII